MAEIWKNIAGWHGKYQVSNLGRIKRLAQVRPVRGQSNRFYPERMCSPKLNKHGYEIVQLWEKGKNSNKQVHRLMAEAFIPNPDNLEQVNHKNGIKNDNRLENLEWVSRRENALHAVYKLNKCGMPCKKVVCITTGIKYPSIHEASRQTGIPAMCISRVANGVREYTKKTKWSFI